LNYSVIAF